uniref:Capsid protein n=1 Tax=Fish-associated ambidensovirus TaxID=3003963 RepID=A0A9E9G0L1_9VIRU|nr:MAG: capsid protein [Fish-associated ambidensovirus]
MPKALPAAERQRRAAERADRDRARAQAYGDAQRAARGAEPVRYSRGARTDRRIYHGDAEHNANEVQPGLGRSLANAAGQFAVDQIEDPLGRMAGQAVLNVIARHGQTPQAVNSQIGRPLSGRPMSGVGTPYEMSDDEGENFDPQAPFGNQARPEQADTEPMLTTGEGGGGGAPGGALQGQQGTCISRPLVLPSMVMRQTFTRRFKVLIESISDRWGHVVYTPVLPGNSIVGLSYQGSCLFNIPHNTYMLYMDNHNFNGLVKNPMWTKTQVLGTSVELKNMQYLTLNPTGTGEAQMTASSLYQHETIILDPGSELDEDVVTVRRDAQHMPQDYFGPVATFGGPTLYQDMDPAWWGTEYSAGDSEKFLPANIAFDVTTNTAITAAYPRNVCSVMQSENPVSMMKLHWRNACTTYNGNAPPQKWVFGKGPVCYNEGWMSKKNPAQLDSDNWEAGTTCPNEEMFNPHNSYIGSAIRNQWFNNVPNYPSQRFAAADDGPFPLSSKVQGFVKHTPHIGIGILPRWKSNGDTDLVKVTGVLDLEYSMEMEFTRYMSGVFQWNYDNPAGAQRRNIMRAHVDHVPFAKMQYLDIPPWPIAIKDGSLEWGTAIHGAGASATVEPHFKTIPNLLGGAAVWDNSQIPLVNVPFAQ